MIVATPRKEHDMNTKILALIAAAAAAVAAGPVNVANGATLPPNWHVHDCTASPCVPPHAPTAFFPYIVGQPLGQYLGDPARCPNATDKALLPPGLEEGQPLRAGVCMTSTQVIGLRSIPAGDPSPAGWALIPAAVPGAVGVIDGVTYRTYFRLSAR